MDLANKVLVVTGGASGIGRATALQLAEGGATVIIGDLNEDGAKAVAGMRAASIHPAKVDLGDAASVQAFARAILEHHGKVDGLVNGAGFDRVQPFMDNDPALWDSLIAVNLVGAIRLTQLLLPSMIQAKAGKIVNIASDAGRVGSMGETVYSATKGGLIAFTKSLAREMARHKINVNCVCPGPTDTPLFNSQASEGLREALIAAIPFRRLASPDDVASAVRFFVGESANYVTGQVLSVSGGLTMVG
jgi:2-hydroxycyclohexanecarboxyl-CoA dehydrogenase